MTPDDRLRRALRTGAPLSDDGFTDRVLARLPPPRRAPPRAAVLAASSVLALAALWRTPAAAWLARTLAHCAASGSVPLSAAMTTAALVAATLGAAAYAARPS
jgi:hypothetical protein